MFLYSNEVRSTASHVPQYRYRASCIDTRIVKSLWRYIVRIDISNTELDIQHVFIFGWTNPLSSKSSRTKQETFWEKITVHPTYIHMKIRMYTKQCTKTAAGMSDRHYKCRIFCTLIYQPEMIHYFDKNYKIEHVHRFECIAPITIKKTNGKFNPAGTANWFGIWTGINTDTTQINPYCIEPLKMKKAQCFIESKDVNPKCGSWTNYPDIKGQVWKCAILNK